MIGPFANTQLIWDKRLLNLLGRCRLILRYTFDGSMVDAADRRSTQSSMSGCPILTNVLQTHLNCKSEARKLIYHSTCICGSLVVWIEATWPFASVPFLQAPCANTCVINESTALQKLQESLSGLPLKLSVKLVEIRFTRIPPTPRTPDQPSEWHLLHRSAKWGGLDCWPLAKDPR